MRSRPLDSWRHEHVYLGEHHARNERRTWLVIALTAITMIVEIAAGWAFGSMALLADGWHMATHAGALSISALAYHYAQRHRNDPRFTFGTGKLGDLAAYTSAVALGIAALLIAWESLARLVTPVPIAFATAIAVAVAGLIVNLASAVLLHEGREHRHGHDASGTHHHAHDHNLRAAYLHVVADALTSVLAIAGLLAGALLGWAAMDPLVGLVGAVVIARWSLGLLRQAGAVLLDVAPTGHAAAIRDLLERDGDRVSDLHVWRVGPGHHAAVVALVSPRPQPPERYRERLAGVPGLSHVTVEVAAGTAAGG